MKQVNRYLQTVKLCLPASQQNDILAELSQDIHAQIDDLEAERGHKLDDQEVRQLLKKRGSPLLVAGNYLPQQNLIGPTFFPLYRFVLKLVVLWIQVPLFIAVIGPINIITSAHPGEAILATAFQLLQTAFVAFGVITLIFAALDRAQMPQKAQKQNVSRRTSITDLFTAIARTAIWTYLVRFHASFTFNGVHLALAPVWQRLFWPILFLLVCSVLVHVYSMVAPAHARLQTLVGLTVDGIGLGIIFFLFTTRAWVELSVQTLGADALEKAARWTNANVAIMLLIAAIVIVVDIVQESRAFRGMNKSMQIRQVTP